MTNHQSLRATLSDLAGRALDTFSEITGFVAVRDRHRWEERSAMTYHLPHQEFADLQHGVILQRRTPKARHRPMTNAAYLRQYLGGFGFVAGAGGRNIPQWVGGLLGR
jgi:hypothetical protein